MYLPQTFNNLSSALYIVYLDLSPVQFLRWCRYFRGEFSQIREGGTALVVTTAVRNT